jgi:hypothetical protein
MACPQEAVPLGAVEVECPSFGEQEFTRHTHPIHESESCRFGADRVRTLAGRSMTQLMSAGTNARNNDTYPQRSHVYRLTIGSPLGDYVDFDRE